VGFHLVFVSDANPWLEKQTELAAARSGCVVLQPRAGGVAGVRGAGGCRGSDGSCCSSDQGGRAVAELECALLRQGPFW